MAVHPGLPATHANDVQDKMKEYDCVIIGAGMAALHVAAQLPDTVLQGTLVVDRSGKWLAQWKEKFRRLDSEILRTPASATPHREPGALLNFARAQQLEKGLTISSSSYAALPSVKLMESFCKTCVLPKLDSVQSNSHILEDTVLKIVPSEPGCRIDLASGLQLQAKAAVYSCPQRQKIYPEWASSAPTGATGSREGCMPDRHASLLQGIKFVQDLDLTAEDVTGKRIAIIGGGMTAAYAALGACRKGAHKVLLASRSPGRVLEYACEAGWAGGKLLNAFWGVTNWQERMQICRKARGRASINSATRAHLDAAVQEGTLLMKSGCEVKSVSSEGGCFRLMTQPELQLGDSREMQSWNEIWLATGDCLDVAADPILGALMEQSPTQVVGGYPVLTEALAWPKHPLFLVGRATTLQLGPMAGEMRGMKAAALRVSSALAAAETAAPSSPLPWDLLPLQSSGPELPLDGCQEAQRAKSEVVWSSHTRSTDEKGAEHCPRKQVDSYSWANEGFKLRIVLSVDDKICMDQVHATFGSSSIDFQARGAAAVHCLQLPKLYSRILPERCSVRVTPSGKVHLVLHKVADQDWRFLKG